MAPHYKKGVTSDDPKKKNKQTKNLPIILQGDRIIYEVLTCRDALTLPVDVLMSLARPSVDPVRTRVPSLLHSMDVSGPWWPS